MSRVTLHHGDSREVLRRLYDQGVRVQSAVMDPPYYLESIVRRFGAANAAPAKEGSDGAFARQSRGFMGQRWDGAEEDGQRIAQDPEFWRLVYDLMTPGAYLLAFSSPRTGHWQACAMELAGFTMHPFLGWLYGQGFPKDHDAAMAIDKLLGTPGERLSGSYQPGTAEGAQWDGWAYGAQAMKPALEPIYVGQKPFSEKTGARNLLVHGVGAVNIDACRVPAVASAKRGRHPANLLHDGSKVVAALFPRDAGARAPVRTRGADKFRNVYGAFAGHRDEAASTFHGDSGTAARFFNAFPLTDDDYRHATLAGEIDPLDATAGYFAKATKADRAGSGHPTVKPIALMQWLCRLVTPPGGVVLDCFAGSGTTGQAALNEGFSAILVEREAEYAADIRRRFGLPSPSLPAELSALLGGDPILDLLG